MIQITGSPVVSAGQISSAGAADGQVATADGAGGVAWVAAGALLATGATVGATSQAQVFTNGVGIGVTSPATALQVATTLTTSPRGIMSAQHSTGADGARFHMRKSRGTNASPTIIVTGDMLGRLVASGYDGANYLEMGGIDIVATGTIASTRVPTEIRFMTATDATPSVLTQRMVIDKAGSVGIGTAAPLATFDISNGSFLLTGQPVSDGWLQEIRTNADGVAGRYFTRFYSDYDNNSQGQTERFSVQTNGAMYASGPLGLGAIAPATQLHVISATTSAGAIRNVLTLSANVLAGIGTPGLGPAIVFQAESSTTLDTTQARIAALWYEATHATFKSDLVGYASDAGGEREGWRVRGAGSEPALGFYGVAPVARALLATGAGATVDNVITALQNLGLVKQA